MAEFAAPGTTADFTKEVRIDVLGTYAGGIGQKMARDLGVAETSMGRFRSATADLALGIGGAIIATTAYGTKQAVQLEQAQASVEAKFRMSKKQVSDYTSWIQKNNEKLLQSQKDMWSSLGVVIAAGYGQGTTKLIESGAAKLTAVFGGDLKNNTITAVSLIKAYNIQTAQIPKTFDLINQAAIMSGKGLGMYSSYLGKILMVAASAKIPLNDMLTTVADITHMLPGAGGGRAIQTLSSMIANSTNPTTTVIKAVEGQTGNAQMTASQVTNWLSANLGIDFGKYGIHQTLQNLLTVYQANPTMGRALIGGAQNIAMIKTMASAPQMDLNKAKTLNQSYHAIENTSYNQLKRLGIKFQDMSIQLGEVMIPVLNQFAGAASGAIDKLDQAIKIFGPKAVIGAGVGALGVGALLKYGLTPFLNNRAIKSALGSVVSHTTATMNVEAAVVNITGPGAAAAGGESAATTGLVDKFGNPIAGGAYGAAGAGAASAGAGAGAGTAAGAAGAEGAGTAAAGTAAGIGVLPAIAIALSGMVGATGLMGLGTLQASKNPLAHWGGLLGNLSLMPILGPLGVINAGLASINPMGAFGKGGKSPMGNLLGGAGSKIGGPLGGLGHMLDTASFGSLFLGHVDSGGNSWVSRLRNVLGSAKKAFTNFLGNLGSLKDDASSKASNLWNAIAKPFKGNLKNVPGWGLSLVKNLAIGLADVAGVGGVVTSAMNIWHDVWLKIGARVTDAAGWGLGVAKQLAVGLADVSGISAVIDSAKGIWHNIWINTGGKAGDAIGWGKTIAGNMAGGIVNNLDKIGKASHDAYHTIHIKDYADRGKSAGEAVAEGVANGITSKQGLINAALGSSLSVGKFTGFGTTPGTGGPSDVLKAFINYTNKFDHIDEQCTALATKWLQKIGKQVPNAQYAYQWSSSQYFKQIMPSNFNGPLSGNEVRGYKGVNPGDVLVWKPNDSATQTGVAGHVDIFYKFGRKNGQLGFWTYDANWGPGSNEGAGTAPQLTWHPIANLQNDISGYLNTPSSSASSIGNVTAAGSTGSFPGNVPSSAMKYAASFAAASKKYGIPINVLLDIASHESSMFTNIGTSAMGGISGPGSSNLGYNPNSAASIRDQIMYSAKLLSGYKGTWAQRLSMYNVGSPTGGYTGGPYGYGSNNGSNNGSSGPSQSQINNAAKNLGSGTSTKLKTPQQVALDYWKAVMEAAANAYKATGLAGVKVIDFTPAMVKLDLKTQDHLIWATWHDKLAALNLWWSKLSKSEQSQQGFKDILSVSKTEIGQAAIAQRQKLKKSLIDIPLQKKIADDKYIVQTLGFQLKGQTKPWAMNKKDQAAWLQHEYDLHKTTRQMQDAEAKLACDQHNITMAMYKSRIAADKTEQQTADELSRQMKTHKITLAGGTTKAIHQIGVCAAAVSEATKPQKKQSAKDKAAKDASGGVGAHHHNHPGKDAAGGVEGHHKTHKYTPPIGHGQADQHAKDTAQHTKHTAQGIDKLIAHAELQSKLLYFMAQQAAKGSRTAERDLSQSAGVQQLLHA
jgi:hypothetical protein